MTLFTFMTGGTGGTPSAGDPTLAQLVRRGFRAPALARLPGDPKGDPAPTVGRYLKPGEASVAPPATPGDARIPW